MGIIKHYGKLLQNFLLRSFQAVHERSLDVPSIFVYQPHYVWHPPSKMVDLTIVRKMTTKRSSWNFYITFMINLVVYLLAQSTRVWKILCSIPDQIKLKTEMFKDTKEVIRSCQSKNEWKIQWSKELRGSVDWACVTRLSFCFEET